MDKLAELKRDFRLVLLSNTNPIHWRKAVDDYFTQGGLNVNYYFEKTYLSYEMRMLKPDEEIYRKVLDSSGMDAGDTLFIDDSKANCAAAERLGITSMHVTCGDEWTERL